MQLYRLSAKTSLVPMCFTIGYHCNCRHLRRVCFPSMWALRRKLLLGHAMRTATASEVLPSRSTGTIWLVLEGACNQSLTAVWDLPLVLKLKSVYTFEFGVKLDQQVWCILCFEPLSLQHVIWSGRFARTISAGGMLSLLHTRHESSWYIDNFLSTVF